VWDSIKSTPWRGMLSPAESGLDRMSVCSNPNRLSGGDARARTCQAAPVSKSFFLFPVDAVSCHN
jgi:hypothetical protein